MSASDDDAATGFKGAVDDADLLGQLTEVIGETGQCLDALLARRASLNACIQLAEELHRHLHAAHSTVAQRIVYLSGQIQYSDHAHGLPSQADSDASSFRNEPERLKPERLIAEARGLSERLQDEMMPPLPPQVGGAARGKHHGHTDAHTTGASHHSSLSMTNVTESNCSPASQPPQLQLPAAPSDASMVPFVLQGVLSIGPETGATESGHSHDAAAASRAPSSAASPTVAAAEVVSASSGAHVATSHSLPADSIPDANGRHASKAGCANDARCEAGQPVHSQQSGSERTDRAMARR